MSKYDVFGMCNPLFDVHAEVADETLAALGYPKGSMSLIEQDAQRQLISRVQDSIVHRQAGGSGANSMIGIALLGGKAAFTGHVGDDERATSYGQSLAEQGVEPHLGAGKGDTGVCVVMVTPDSERTMCTYLGMSRELRSDDVDLQALRASRYLYVTGYLWDTESQKEAVLHAMSEANRAGVKVALSLSDPFCVNRHRDDFRRIVADHVDLVIGNDSEAQALTDADTPADAARALAEMAEMAAVTLGASGSLVRVADSAVQVPACTVKAVDTTGAGDMYAGALLFGITHDLPLDKTGRVAAFMSAQVVAKIGPRLDGLDRERLSAFVAGEE